MQNETIQSLQKANRSLVNENLALLNELHNGYNVVNMKLDRFIADLNDAVSRLVAVDQAVLDMAATQKTNTESRKKFEAGYYGRIGE